VGSLLEKLIFSEFIKRNHHLCQLREYYYWRDSNDHEENPAAAKNSGTIRKD
jgi:predicted AAA+ superfamily ATPase